MAGGNAPPHVSGVSSKAVTEGATIGANTKAVRLETGSAAVAASTSTPHVKISPCVSQKRLRFGDDVDKREFIKFAKKYHQQLEEEECASVGRVTVRAMSPPRLADIGVLLQEAEDATRD